jgi:hypothetical protein
MKDINQMNLAELANALQRYEFDMLNEQVASRLRVLHEQTRWIPVEERLPTKADGDMDGRVLVFERGKYTPHKTYTRFVKWDSVDDVDYFYTVTHWQRITKPNP